jgi:hypothetical protein
MFRIKQDDKQVDESLLPMLVFAESHDDPINSKILNLLIPKLKALGYGYFFDEVPSSHSLEDAIKGNDENFKLLIKLKEHAEEHKLNILDPKDQVTYLWNHFDLADFIYEQEKISFEKQHSDQEINEKVVRDNIIKYLNTDNRVIRYFRLIQCNFDKYFAIINNKIFLDNLKKNNIHYQGINPGDLFLEGMGGDSFEYLFERMKYRDEQMASHFTSRTEGIFARVGVSHAKGLLKKLPSSSLFFNLYTFELRIQEDESSEYNEFFKFPREVREGTTPIIPIDARSQTDDQICEFIIEKVKNAYKEAQKKLFFSRQRYIINFFADNTELSIKIARVVASYVDPDDVFSRSPMGQSANGTSPLAAFK